MRAVIFLNGELGDLQMLRSLLRKDDFLIAADGGLQHLRQMALVPQLLIGDLDSVTEEDLAWLEQRRVEIQRFTKDKDFTDLDLALQAARERGYTEIMLVAALGGRVDQMLANLLIPHLQELLDYPIYLEDGHTEIRFLRNQLTLQGKAGDLVSLLALCQPVYGVRTMGLKYPLNSETLSPGQTRGISNVMQADQARIEIDRGWLMCVHIRTQD